MPRRAATAGDHIGVTTPPRSHANRKPDTAQRRVFHTDERAVAAR